MWVPWSPAHQSYAPVPQVHYTSRRRCRKRGQTKNVRTSSDHTNDSSQNDRVVGMSGQSVCDRQTVDDGGACTRGYMICWATNGRMLCGYSVWVYGRRAQVAPNRDSCAQLSLTQCACARVPARCFLSIIIQPSVTYTLDDK